MMTFGSLFAGIGGMDLGLERAGMECRWQVEIDEYASKVLAKHWPNVKRYGDIRTVDTGELERVDLIAGGFPCQDISNAGKRAGIGGERSGLWSEFARIVCDLRPHYVLVENVAALLVRGIERVLGDLAACGYDAEWECLPASTVGAPHLRDRVYIVAYPASIISDGLQIYSLWQQQGMGSQWKSRGRYFAEIPTKSDWLLDESPFCGSVDGISNRLEQLKGFGNAVVPQVAEWIGRRIVEADAKTN